jgi:hypothetical protein
MALGIYEEEDIRAIANSIRNNLGDDTKYTTEQMPDAINVIQVYAYNSGHSEGWSDGWISGNNQGLEQGRTEGIEEGKAIGYEEGKTDGIAEGKKSQYDEDWDNLQNFGNKNNYAYFFRSTAFEFIRPKHKVKAGGNDGVPQLCFSCSNLKKIEAEYFDLSGLPNSASSQGLYYAFGSCPKLEEIEDIGIPPLKRYDYAFAWSNNLHTIAKIRPDENTAFTNAFQGCRALMHIIVDGVIAKAVNFQDCTKLTHDSLMSIIDALKDFSGTSTWNTITLGADNLAKLTQEELDIMHLKQWEYT